MFSSFDSDLVESQGKENELADLLRSWGCIVSTSQNRGKFIEFDLLVYDAPDSSPIKIELKFDRLSEKTGNVAVELYTMLNGQKKFSGITATKSDLLSYCFPGDRSFYFISPAELLELARRKSENVVFGGDGGRACIALIRKEIFIENCLRLN